MNPILFAKSETAYTSNGLGRLQDVTQCTVTEELNGAYELAMSVAITDSLFSEITTGRQIGVKVSDGSLQPFRIDQITRPLNGIVNIHAYHVSYDLSRYVYPVWSFYGNPNYGFNTAMKNHCIGGSCPFTMASTITTQKGLQTLVPRSFKDVLGAEEGSFLTLFGGEFEWDKTTIKFTPRRGADRGYTIRYAKNLTNIRASEDGDTYNSVVPYATGNDGLVVTGGIQTHGTGIDGVVPVDVTDRLSDSVLADLANNTPAINAAGLAWLNENKPWEVIREYSVSFVNENNDTILLGDDVTVYYGDADINIKLRVVKTVWNALEGRYSNIDIGTPERIISKQMAKQEAQTQSQIASSVDMTQALANGNYNGGTFISGQSANIVGGSLNIGNSKFVVDSNGNVTMAGSIALNGSISWGGSNPPITDANGIFSALSSTYIQSDGLYSPTIVGNSVQVCPGNNQSNGRFEIHKKVNNVDTVVGYIGSIGTLERIGLFYSGASGDTTVSGIGLECGADGVRLFSDEGILAIDSSQNITLASNNGNHWIKIDGTGIYMSEQPVIRSTP